MVLYTSPTCGPCRTLKPIFSKVADEFSGKVRCCCQVQVQVHLLANGGWCGFACQVSGLSYAAASTNALHASGRRSL